MAKEKSETGRPRLTPAAPSPKSAEAPAPASKIAATTQPLSLKPGRYMIQHLGIEGGSKTIDNRVYPFAVLFSPDRLSNGGASVTFAGPDGATLVRLLTPGDKAAVEVRGGDQPLFFTVYNAPGAASGIRLGLKRLQPEAATAAATPALQITAHLQEIGDQQSRGAAWAGLRGSRLRLEGFRVDPLPPAIGVEIEYMAGPAAGKAAWSSAGALAGSRGRALPLGAFAARLKGAKASAFDIVYQGHFFPSGDTPVLKNGEICRGRTDGDILVALRMNLVAKGAAPALSAAAPSRGRASDIVEVSDAVVAASLSNAALKGRSGSVNGTKSAVTESKTKRAGRKPAAASARSSRPKKR